MKSVLVLVAILTSSLMASATSIDRTAVVATVTGEKENIKMIALLADGRLQVKSLEGKVTTLKLSKAATTSLVESAQNLAEIELSDETYQVVCMMMPMADLTDLSVSTYDFASKTFKKGLTLVLTADNCAVSHRVKPIHEDNIVAAAELRKALVVLALNSVK